MYKQINCKCFPILRRQMQLLFEALSKLFRACFIRPRRIESVYVCLPFIQDEYNECRYCINYSRTCCIVPRWIVCKLFWACAICPRWMNSMWVCELFLRNYHSSKTNGILGDLQTMILLYLLFVKDEYNYLRYIMNYSGHVPFVGDEYNHCRSYIKFSGLVPFVWDEYNYCRLYTFFSGLVPFVRDEYNNYRSYINFSGLFPFVWDEYNYCRYCINYSCLITTHPRHKKLFRACPIFSRWIELL